VTAALVVAAVLVGGGTSDTTPPLAATGETPTSPAPQHTCQDGSIPDADGNYPMTNSANKPKHASSYHP
jgi:hypothetical protein